MGIIPYSHRLKYCHFQWNKFAHHQDFFVCFKQNGLIWDFEVRPKKSFHNFSFFCNDEDRIITGSQIHRRIQVGRDLKRARAGAALMSEQVAQGCVQSGLENFQG